MKGMCNCPECAEEIEQLHNENDKWAKFYAEQNGTIRQLREKVKEDEPNESRSV